MATQNRLVVLIIVGMFTAFQSNGTANALETVSPGAMDRITEVERRCPTFIWEAVPGAAYFEVVVYRVPDGLGPERMADESLTEAEEVLYAQVPGGAPAWTPDVAKGLEWGGSYVWFVRAMYGGIDGEFEAGEWSAGRFFSVSRLSSEPDAAEVVDVLRRFQAAGGSLDDLISVDGYPANERFAPSGDAATGSRSLILDSPKSVTSAKTAIRGSQSDTAGETYGVVGISHSIEGAGVGAAGVAGGPDVILDGGGAPDTVLTQDGVYRSSGTGQTFTIANPDVGTMTLAVDGFITGDGSQLTGIDAEFLNGEDASAYAPSIHIHDEKYFTETELSTSGAGGAVHWENLTAVPTGLDDGDDDTTFTAGVGLSLHGTQFSVSAFEFTPRDIVITTVDSSANVGLYIDMAIGADGYPIISYMDNSGSALKVAHCADAACTTATATTIDDLGNVGHNPSIAIGADGLAFISYYDSTNGDLKTAHCTDVVCSSATLNTLDALEDVGRHTSVTIGTDGMPFVTYKDMTNDDLKVAHCSDPACSSASISTVDSDGNVGSYSSVALGADGLPVISYEDATNADLKVAHCSDTTCSSASITSVDSEDLCGRYTSITVGIDGNPLISYQDWTDFDLKVAHCADPKCTSASITSFENPGTTGNDTSITIGSAGLPLITYYDGTQDDLVFVHCSNIACTAATVSTVDSDGDVGRKSSVLVGADGLPVISYAEGSPGNNLKLAHCPNQFCVPFARRW